MHSVNKLCKPIKTKKTVLIGALLMSSCILSACGSKEDVSQTEEIGTLPDTTWESEVLQEEEMKPEEETEPEVTELSDKEKVAAAYEEAILRARDFWQMPDGTEVEHSGVMSGTNQYAIYDVDLDGRDELIFRMEKVATMADMREDVYEYYPKTGEFHQELVEFPGVQYYDNRIALVGWSHNQGKGNTLWPYNIYHYDEKLDEYIWDGSVDSWDKDFVPDGYPDEADTCKLGTVFDIYYPGYNQYKNMYNDEIHYYSKTDYDRFCREHFDGMELLEIPYKEIYIKP